MSTKVTISRNLIYLVSIILAFITAAIFIWLWYDLNLRKLDEESQRLEKAVALHHHYSTETFTSTSLI